jgi:quercetin dioxygenase-like cupin family protein
MLYHRGTTVVRRLTLAPGEATRWHRDPFHRVSVVFKGDALTVEFRDGSESQPVKVTPGQVDWDEPGSRIHRAVNTGDGPYEEITVFFLAHPEDVPQPDAP